MSHTAQMRSNTSYLNANVENKCIEQRHIVAGALHDGLLLAQGNTAAQGSQEGPSRVSCSQVTLHLTPVRRQHRHQFPASPTFVQYFRVHIQQHVSCAPKPQSMRPVVSQPGNMTAEEQGQETGNMQLATISIPAQNRLLHVT